MGGEFLDRAQQYLSYIDAQIESSDRESAKCREDAERYLKARDLLGGPIPFSV